MKKLFVPQAIASILIEKGFKEEMLGVYYLKGEDNVRKTMFAEDGNAPMYQQVVDWFRDEKDILIIINKSVRGYYYNIDNSNSNYPSDDKTYYEALNKAIEEALKLI